MISAAKQFLSIGDAVNWYTSFGLPPRTANVQKIKFIGAKKYETLMMVKWDMIHECTILLANGMVIDGDKLEPFDEHRNYQYPEQDRIN